MPSVEKIIDKMIRQPNGIRPEEAENPLKKVYIMDILNRISQSERS